MKFLQGSYGLDLLSLLLILLASILTFWDFTIPLSVLLIIYAFYRAFSKKIYKRRDEYNVFYSYTNKILNKFGVSIPENLPVYDLNNISKYFEILKYKFQQYRQYKITKCPKCNQKLRLPRGKGNIVVTCKSCGNKFDLRT